MNEKIEKVKNDIETFLKDTMDHQNKHIDYILYDPDNDNIFVLASDDYGEAIEFTPFTKEYDGGYLEVPEWDYNFDYYIYNYLEEGKRIGYMTDEVHYSIWNSIHELYPEDIDSKTEFKHIYNIVQTMELQKNIWIKRLVLIHQMLCNILKDQQ